MKILYCSQCGGQMSVADEHVGRVMCCPHCSARVETQRLNETTAPPTGGPPPYGEMLSHRNKVVAGLLGIFLGGLGVHRFYLGYVGIGFLQLFLTFATCGVASLWGFIEGILCLADMMTDVEGRRLRD